MFFGCHLSATGGNAAMVKTALSIGANTFAFFTRNPRGSKAKKEDPADAAKAVAMLEENDFGPLVAHGAYTMNLCTADPEARAFAAEVLEDDLRRMAALPGNFYNFHPGSHVGQGVDAGIEYISAALKKALRHDYPVKVLLETMAGKGSEVGGRFEELKAIIDAVGSSNVGVCLEKTDTIPAGHKVALRDIPKGRHVIKYGQVIGRATADIQKGDWVHSHNLRTQLDESVAYTYQFHAQTYQEKKLTFQGFVRQG